MSIKYVKLLSCVCFISTLLIPYYSTAQDESKPRVLISTDIGGTDPDDFQSMIHLLMYADLFQIEGLVSSPFGKGRKKDILDMIDLYKKDFGQLKAHSASFPEPDALSAVCKQGAIHSAPYKGYATATEGSEWMIKSARKSSDHPLWVLVWGGLEDIAQALHDAPDIKENIRVYWIGGPNKKWSVNAYAYIAEHHPDLWMIEANATYRGWFMDEASPQNISGEAYYDNYIQGRGAMGKAFKSYYDGRIKMGDTPSLAYLMHGNPDDPTTESWGGSFTRIEHSSRAVFEGNSSTEDTVAAYAVLEWRFKGPEKNIPQDSVCFMMEIWDQVWPGYYLGNGIYGIRYSPKRPEKGTYLIASNIPELDSQHGQYVSINPWPGTPDQDDYHLGDHWYSDRQEPNLFIEDQQGAKTIARYREAYLLDWAKRWKWLKSDI
ncbi:hypothetical protein OKW21_006014 [Catalinimonas alkaloidigena]|uniref:nucleoside hydrolase-like domain-containing protein n=1 Tax=Catalinimonas alkaloidigena TaxID=1075417 RepID=UPI0024057FA5|nr:nucleoside hydrolase-like domain-containing protein [Catalinimonas alkaloidigena]MDF9800751.1 hypothetical protein [Catalinimonas alkaloidigena]